MVEQEPDGSGGEGLAGFHESRNGPRYQLVVLLAGMSGADAGRVGHLVGFVSHPPGGVERNPGSEGGSVRPRSLEQSCLSRTVANRE